VPVFSATASSAEAPLIDPGLCDATFVGVSVKRIEGGNFGDGDRFVWAFQLLDDDGEVIYEEREDHDRYGDPVIIDGLTSLSTNTKSKTQPRAVRYLKALMTDAEFAAFVDGADVEAETLIDRKVQVDIGIRDNGWPTVANVLPARKARTSKARA
jgi:hypothetical protein